MSKVRILLPRAKANSAIIEAFHCSCCAWEHMMQKQQPGIIVYEEVDRAAQIFDQHRCELYPPRIDQQLALGNGFMVRSMKPSNPVGSRRGKGRPRSPHGLR